MKSRFLAYALMTAAILWGCDEEKPAAPYDAKELLWDVDWSYTSGNILYDAGSKGYGLQPSGWANVFKTAASYNFTPYLNPVENTPDIQIDYTDVSTLRNSSHLFIIQYVDNNDMNIAGEIILNLSFLVGTNNMKGKTGTLGVTTWRGYTTGDPATSFVFTTRIRSISWLTTDEERWKAVSQVVLHELGHARGLNAYNYELGDPDWDHNHHTGTDPAACAMNGLSVVPWKFEFCPYHAKVLGSCLKFIQVDYDFKNNCAKE